MSNEYNVAPVDHGFFSATGNVAAGTAGGALKSAGKAFLWCTVGGTVLGAAALAIAASGLGLLGALALGSLGAIGGGFAGAGLGTVLLAPSAAIGAVKGGSQASDRVSRERYEAKMMDMQLAAYQAAAQAGRTNKYDLPEQGSAMNSAMAQIDASSAQNLGSVAVQQRALA